MLSPTPGGAARRRGARLVAFFALLALAAPAAGQPLSGTVVQGTRPVAGAPLEVHRVTPGERGIVRSLESDAAGRFTATLPPPADSGFTVYFVTALVNGVHYFGPVLHGDDRPADYRIAVYDTTSAAAAVDSVRVVRRDVILSAAGDGGWEVAELVRLRNTSGRTLVPAQAKPVVGIPLPEGSSAFQAGEDEQRSATDSARADLVRIGDRAWVNAPVVPGERDLIFRYRLPATPQRVVLPLAHATDSMNVYLRQPAPDAEVRGIPEGEPFAAEGERFRRFVGAALSPGSEVVLDWRGPAGAPVDPRWAAMAVAGVILAVGAWLAFRRPRTT